MDRLRKLEDAISRENEEDISNLEEYFTKLLKVKQNQRQLDESALLDKILNMRKDATALSFLPEDQFNLLSPCRQGKVSCAKVGCKAGTCY